MGDCQTGFSLGFDGDDSEARDSVELDDDSIYVRQRKLQRAHWINGACMSY